MDRVTSLSRGMRTTLGRVMRDTRGATVVEYGFIIALVILAMMVALGEVADVTVNMWGNINTKVQNAR
ncbi:Flp family type IVb pilin [Sphingomonas sp.]|jgi:pilus assembly protein Flp/PilA|uniref:Flp family type IVb pilin n=1 Tax=Sphingomonas sp. TaxID=28214 RepID=UPI0035C790D8